MTMQDLEKVADEIDGPICKNLFLKDKTDFYLLVLENATQISLKDLPMLIGSSRLSFANISEMNSILNVSPGSVSPLALYSESSSGVKVILDNKILNQEKINFHPCRNDMTTTISADDLINFLSSVHHKPRIVSF